MYFEPLGTVFPPIPENPTREDALAALEILLELLSEFPFVDEASRSVAISAILTAVGGVALSTLRQCTQTRRTRPARAKAI